MLALFARLFSNVKLGAHQVPAFHDASEGSSTAQPETSPGLDNWVACTESKPGSELCIAPCSHAYCTICITKMFEDSLKDESIYPPRCCGREVALEPVRDMLGSEFVRAFMTRAIEVATPARTYCHVATCSSFITNGLGFCESCSVATCTQCKQAAHNGDCAAASHTAVLELAKKQGWQSCPSCHAVVELRDGCNHIT